MTDVHYHCSGCSDVWGIHVPGSRYQRHCPQCGSKLNYQIVRDREDGHSFFRGFRPSPIPVASLLQLYHEVGKMKETPPWPEGWRS